jgi:dTDP-4-dehydrorhamnose 3,5-epimerase
MKMIDGVVQKKLRVIADERGYLMEMLRVDDDLFDKFGQVYMTAVYPGVVKGWHYHKSQTDYMACVFGMIKLVLFDARVDSPTYREINEFFIGEKNPALVKILPGIYHGFKGIATQPAIIVNTVNEPYNYEKPDEFRVQWDSPDVPYNWALKNG